MTDDGFIFGDDSDENTGDETLFGTSSAESPETTTETDRRFGTTTADDTDSQFGQHVRVAVSGSTIRTAATVVLAVALVVALGQVGYPLVMDALDGSDGSGGTESTTAGDGAFASSTAPSTTVRPTSETTTGRLTETTLTATETATPTTTATPTPSPTPTPTERTTTAIPTRGFPAGEPVENESDGGS